MPGARQAKHSDSSQVLRVQHRAPTSSLLVVDLIGQLSAHNPAARATSAPTAHRQLHVCLRLWTPVLRCADMTLKAARRKTGGSQSTAAHGVAASADRTGCACSKLTGDGMIVVYVRRRHERRATESAFSMGRHSVPPFPSFSPSSPSWRIHHTHLGLVH